MSELFVTVMRDRYVRSWPDRPGEKPGERAYTVQLAKAFERSYKTDAHFTQYTSRAHRRLSKDAVDHGVTAELRTLVLDVDCPETHGSPEPAPEPWRAEMRVKMHALYAVHADPFYYETKGGARIVYRQPTPIVISSQEDSAIWSQRYAVIVAYVERCFGIVADPACGDWTRLFRLPRATRKPDGAPENWEMIGDLANVGVLDARPTADDLKVAMARSKVFAARQDLDLAPISADGHGLLFHALRNRGHVLRERPSGGFFIKCPRESHHSSGRTGDTSTIMYLPSAGDRVGAIHCMHAHCSQLTVKDWLKEFSREELKAAEADAGLVEKRRA
jgi:hypothetical protein